MRTAQERRFNWRRGLLRIWLTVSAIWIVGVLAVNLPLEQEEFYVGDAKFTFPVGTEKSVISRELFKQAHNMDPEVVAAEAAPVYNPSGLPGRFDPKNAVRLEFVNQIKRQLDAYQPTSHRYQLMMVEITALSFPVALLAFGQIVAWICRGFSDNRAA